VKEFVAALILLSLGLAAVEAKDKVPKGIIQSETLAGYIARMQHAELALSPRTPGSLWVDGGYWQTPRRTTRHETQAI
jgi:hypothetical protein